MAKDTLVLIQEILLNNNIIDNNNTKGVDQNLGKIPGAGNINELQKIILLGMAHILRRFLSIK